MVRKLSLAIAVALGVAPIGVTALGLGDIQLHSALNQNFNADIELLSVKQGEISDVQVELASSSVFEQSGIDRPFFLSDLRFKPEQMPDGSSVIRVSSRDPIREPFLNFLIEVNWPKGSLVREYTVLLDPPVTLDRSPAPVQAPAAQMLPQSRAPVEAMPVGSTSSAAAGYQPGIGEYGPTQRNETLWNIAKKVRHSGVAMEQMVMSLFHANPDAFISSNINNLRVGRILRVPSRDEVLSRGTSREARAAFRGQMEEWRADRVAPSAAIAAQETAAEPSSASAAEMQPEAVLPESELRIASARPEGQGDEQAKVGVGDEQDPMAEAERLRQDLIVAEEAKESALEEGAELQSRVSDLESQLADLQKLLILKNEQLARMQAAAAVAGGEQPVATEEIPQPDEQMLQPEIEVTDTGQAADAAPADETIVDQGLSGEPEETAGEMATPPDDLLVDSETLAIEPEQPATETLAEGDTLVESEAATSEPETAAEAPPSAETETTSEPQAAEPAVEVDAVTATQAAAESEPAVAAESGAPAQQEVAEAKPVAKLQAKPEAKSDPWTMAVDYAKKVAGDPAMLGIAIAVVVVFLALLWAVISRRRSSKADFQESILVNTIDSESETTQSLAEAEPEPVSQTTEETSFLSDFSPSDIDALQDETGEVDPVAEADVYIAYGRYKQAEELIRQAMEREPQRLELKQKLFEILFATKDAEAFVSLAEEATSDGMQQQDPAGWEKVISMGQKLAPTAALFAAAASTGVAQVQDDFSAMSGLEGDETTLAKLDDLDLDLEGLGDLDELAAEDSTTANNGLDFDLDLNLDNAASAEWTPDKPAQEEEEEDTLLDLKSSLEETGSEAIEDLRLELPDEDLVASEDAGGDLEGFGVEADVDGTLESATLENLLRSADDSEATDELQEPVIDFSEEESALDEDSLEALQLAVENESDPEQDIDSEMVVDHPDAVSLDAFREKVSNDMPDDQEQEADEVNTKLDLARAYVDMGDAEGARSLLEEVLNEGNNLQSGEAQRILAELA